MRGRKSPLVVILTVAERQELERWLRSTTLPAGLVRRARAVLLVAEGHSLSETAQLIGFSRKIVRRWVARFLKKRLDGLEDKSGRGRKPVFSPRSSLAPG
jgi:hypothetical protein